MSQIFNIFLYKPLFNVLILLYNFIPTHELGISIIILILFIRILISPLSLKYFKAQKIQSELQPKIKEIKEKHKGDTKKQNEEMMRLYKESGANPFSGCLPILIQLPIFIAIFKILKDVANPSHVLNLYSFVHNPGLLNTTFLGILDLAKSSSILAILAGIFQFIQSKMLSSLTALPKNTSKNSSADQMARMMTQQMTYLMPVILVLIYWKLPSALSLYWIIITIFSIGEQYYMNKKLKNEKRN